MVTVEYMVAGPVLVLIGVAQIWLKRGNAIEAARLAGEAGGDAASVPEPASDSEADVSSAVSPPAQTSADAAEARKPPLWDAWTGILGYVAVALGIVVLVMGLLGK